MKEYRELFKKAEATWGANAQEDVAIEELSELIKAIIKNRRNSASSDPKYLNDMADEIADVLIVCEQLRIIYERFFKPEEAIDIVDERIKYKCERLKNRLEKIK